VKLVNKVKATLPTIQGKSSQGFSSSNRRLQNDLVWHGDMPKKKSVYKLLALCLCETTTSLLSS
jgi:hypothetical protein